MTRDTSLQKYLTMLGVPRGGKGTINWMLGQMVGGNYGSPTYRSILGKNGLEPLRGRQLAIFPDAKGVPKNILSEFCGTFKAIIGEDPLPIDAKYERVVTEQLKLKVILQLNEVLAIPDNSAALEARQLFLHFTNSFVGKEDTQLKVKLAGEFSGIANLFLEGLAAIAQGQRRLHRAAIQPRTCATGAAGGRSAPHIRGRVVRSRSKVCDSHGRDLCSLRGVGRGQRSEAAGENAIRDRTNAGLPHISSDRRTSASSRLLQPGG